MERSAGKPYPSDMSDDDWDVVFADMAHDLRARLRWSEGRTIERAPLRRLEADAPTIRLNNRAGHDNDDEPRSR